jgi:flavin-dependent dehydrogenase
VFILCIKQVSNAMSHSWDYDAIVIGSGPGGEGAAMGLVKQGARVAVIERYHNVGVHLYNPDRARF